MTTAGQAVGEHLAVLPDVGVDGGEVRLLLHLQLLSLPLRPVEPDRLAADALPLPDRLQLLHGQAGRPRRVVGPGGRHCPYF